MTDERKPLPDLPDLKDLDTRLRALQGMRDKEQGGRGSAPSDRGRGGGIGFGFRIGIEFLSAVAVGAVIGYLLDRWLGSAPWLMMLFLFLGGTAGVMNVYRVVQGLDSSVGLGAAERRKENAADTGDRPDSGEGTDTGDQNDTAGRGP